MNKEMILGVDIGGSHVSAALVNPVNGQVVEGSFCKKPVDARQGSEMIIDQWLKALEYSLSKIARLQLKGVGISMPGPFDYNKGVSLIAGVNKYESLFGMNIKDVLKSRLSFQDDLPIHFENDAVCFGVGASTRQDVSQFKRIIAITLGTGLGATFLVDNQIQKVGKGVPLNGYLYNVAFRDGIAEDYISSRWLVDQYNLKAEVKLQEAKELHDLAITKKDRLAIEIFAQFGNNLAECLRPWILEFQAQCLIIGGNISKASALFLPQLQKKFQENDVAITISISETTELSAITGVASLVPAKQVTIKEDPDTAGCWRKTNQPLMPFTIKEIQKENDKYQVYPFTALGSGKIFSGYASLATWIAGHKKVLIDGFAGVDWQVMKEKLDSEFKDKKIRAFWYETTSFQQDEDKIDHMVAPFLGEPDDVWGKKTTLSLKDFYQVDNLRNLQADEYYDVSIIIGVGATLSNWEAPVIYVDLPKNELQFRMRAKSAFNVGKSEAEIPTTMYKRFYFVDWVVLNQHKQQLLDKISVVVDGQWKQDISWIKKADLQKGLQYISKNAIRVRPWFEPGAWGGQWMKKNIPGLNQDEVNYAWSFELIVPENGLLFESDNTLLEVAFDWLMLQESAAVLGKHAGRFGYEFPIRFDFLDTIDGGNLSIQCHPRLSYIQEHFGETITQDETYYILECDKDASVYLGFQETIDPTVFKASLEKSEEEKMELEIEEYVQRHPAKKHDLFLIPNGTIHSSGAGNLVLEISATPYIFTFKMYDWLRLDLNGEPRPINIEHAIQNLDFERKGDRVKKELISHPMLIEQGDNWQLVHLPTHPDHFYDVHRIEFDEEVTVATRDSCHVLMLVEGTCICLKTAAGFLQDYHYAETFVVPAAAGSYQLINKGKGRAKVIKAFLKEQ